MSVIELNLKIQSIIRCPRFDGMNIRSSRYLGSVSIVDQHNKDLWKCKYSQYNSGTVSRAARFVLDLKYAFSLEVRQIYAVLMFPQLSSDMIMAYLELVDRGLLKKCDCNAKLGVLEYLLDPSSCQCKNLFRQQEFDMHQ